MHGRETEQPPGVQGTRRLQGVPGTVRLPVLEMGQLLVEKAGQLPAEDTEPQGRLRLPAAEARQLSESGAGRLQEVLATTLLPLL